MLTAEFKVVQYWNGVANDNKKITLAVRANSEIKDCSWIHLDTEDEYRLVLTIKNDIKVHTGFKNRRITALSTLPLSFYL